MLREGLKALVDILAGKSGCLEVVAESFLFHHFKGFFFWDYSVFFHVSKVSNQVLNNIFLCVIFYLYEPLSHAFKRFTVCYIEANNDCVTLLVKESRDWPETFLSSRVPDLQLNMRFAPHNHTEVSEFNANSHVVLCLEHLVNKPRKNTTFAYACIPDDNNFEQGVLV